MAADPAKTPAPMSAEDKAMMDAWMKAATPGDAHHKLAALEGTWDAKVMMYNEPGAPPELATATTTGTMILGGRFLQTRIENGAMTMGIPYAGVGLTGYDNLKKEYVEAWVDTAGTSITLYEGNVDPATGVLKFTGTEPNLMGGKPLETRHTVTFKDANHYVVEGWEPGPDGKMTKVLEIDYTRRK